MEKKCSFCDWGVRLRLPNRRVRLGGKKGEKLNFSSLRSKDFLTISISKTNTLKVKR